MKLLAIESSCDETAAAVVEDGRTVLSSIVASQVEEHKLYGGVVPENRVPPSRRGDYGRDGGGARKAPDVPCGTSARLA